MKKKLFPAIIALTLIVTLFTAAMPISASAATIVPREQGTNMTRSPQLLELRFYNLRYDDPRITDGTFANLDSSHYQVKTAEVYSYIDAYGQVFWKAEWDFLNISSPRYASLNEVFKGWKFKVSIDSAGNPRLYYGNAFQTYINDDTSWIVFNNNPSNAPVYCYFQVWETVTPPAQRASLAANLEVIH